MARVTVEDCITKVPNRFELVLVAAQRARDLASGGSITVDRDDDKNPVVALREIADSTIDVDQLQNALVTGLQRQPEIDEPEEDRELSIGDTGWPAGGPGQSLEEDELREDMLFVNDADSDVDAEAETDLDILPDFPEEPLDEGGALPDEPV